MRKLFQFRVAGRCLSWVVIGWHIAVLVGTTACGDSVQPLTTFIPTDSVFWSLTLNHRAVNLGTTSPYDTVQLVALPRNILGEILTSIPPATFASNDSSVLVFPDGRIQGRTQHRGSQSAPVVATLTYRGVTRVDTAFVRVTNVVNPPRLHRFTFEVPPGDSTRIASRGFEDIWTKSVPLIVRDTADAAIPRLNVYYESSDPAIAEVNRHTGVLTALLRGTVTVRASAMVYGVAMTDSIVYTITDPLAIVFILGEMTGGLLPQDPVRYLSPGGNVIWINQTSTKVDLTFNDPSAVFKGNGSVAVFAADTSGNIAPFGATPGNDPDLDVLNQIRIRSFPLRGTYSYRSAQAPAIRGTIIVR